MFFTDTNRINEYIKNSGFSIFVLPNIELINLPETLSIHPDDKDKIGIDAVRDTINQCITKQVDNFYITVFNAEKMSIAAQNAFLKFLEEPSENYHIIFAVNSISGLLKTVISRADLYIYKEKNILEKPIDAQENIKVYARKLLACTDSELVSLSNEITKDKEYKKKENARAFVLKICQSAIEIAYKSYFKTRNDVFIKKIPKLLLLYDNLRKNGNIKLHIVADLC
ncbi:hypothetical protein IJG79_02280 [Candidatus Saccharibacteria bacterium]|nr:hypothetical protein [Candidatus Saccharibacteria bacterium]